MTINDNIDAHFSQNYREAREKFLAICKERGISVQSIKNDQVKDADVFTDIARIGPKDADQCIFIFSGTHGVEGYCGSGVQIDAISAGLFDDLPDDMAVVLIHAVNPSGFHLNRRVTEDNVDLNRSFVDFSKELPSNKNYARIHPFLMPEDWDGPSYAAAQENIERFIEVEGYEAYKDAFSGGQYEFPEGVFYGGSAPTWSRKMLTKTLPEQAGKATRVAVLDVHTGLGEFGHLELICMDAQDQFPRAQSWFSGEVTCPSLEGSSSSSPIEGTIGAGIAPLFPNAELTYVALEYGTVPVPDVIQAFRAENWLHHNPDADPKLAADIRTKMRDAFYQDVPAWKAMVVDRSRKTIKEAMRGLSR